MTPLEVFQRCILLCIGLFIIAFGVGFSIKANLGTSPVSSFPYVASLIFPLTVGEFTIILHCVFILIQIILLRRRYRPIQLIQLPVAIAFGFLTDLSVYILSWLNPTNYGFQWICCVIGIILIAIGVSLEVYSRITTLASDGLVVALSQVTRFKFSTLKVCFDVTMVVIAAILSLIGLHTLAGVREGTLAAAIFVGLLTRRVNPWTEKLEKRLFHV